VSHLEDYKITLYYSLIMSNTAFPKITEKYIVRFEKFEEKIKPK